MHLKLIKYGEDNDELSKLQHKVAYDGAKRD